MEEVVTTFEHMGRRISLDMWGHFNIEGEEGPLRSLRFERLKDAKEEVERLHKIHAKSRKLSLAVRNDKGELGHISGLHMGTCEVTYSGFAQHRPIAIYPDVPWIQQRLEHLARLGDEIARLQDGLDPFHLRTRWGYGRVSVEEYLEKFSKLEEEYQVKRRMAEEEGERLVEVQLDD